jgi:hypothetical protein
VTSARRISDKHRLVLFGLCLVGVLQAASALAQRASDDSIRQMLVEESLAGYPGNCPCPYNRMRNGKLCGDFSAYRKPGGRSPLCYPRDVTQGMIDDYRRRKGLAN